jgi:beta-lactamase regulating signal transducer with metallopeptidase domain
VRPYVVLPAACVAELDPQAREAALRHELAHLTYHDPLLLLLLGVFSDVFWFLPGQSWLLRRVVAELDLCADARAVRDGARPECLAEALVSVGERLHAPLESTPALVTRRRLLLERVARLLGGQPDRARALYRDRLGRVLVFAVFVPSLLTSVFFGNP